MTDAQSAIIDIQEALAEYGSVITFKSITQGAYDPLTGNTETSTDTITNAIINRFASRELSEIVKDNTTVNTYELAAMFYHASTVKVNDKIVLNGATYNIIHVSPLYLQDVIIKYEVLIKR